MAVGEAIVLMRRAQIEHERKLATVEEKADRALQQAEAAARAADNNYGWFTVLGYCNRTGRRVTEQESARHGKHLSDMLRKRGVEKRKTAQSRWGTVGLYPEALLMEYFGDRLPADYPGPWPQLFEAHA